MPIYKIPDQPELDLRILLLDLNGTLAIGGKLVDGVSARIEALKQAGYEIYILTGNHRGNANEISQRLGIEYIEAHSSAEKAEVTRRFPTENVVSIGNSRIDIGMFENSKLSIVTIQKDGVHSDVVSSADIVVTNINDALDMLLDPSILAETLRK